MIQSHATLIATAAGLTTALCWGTSDWLAAKTSKKLSALQINFGLQLVSIVLVSLLWVVSDIQLPTLRQFLTIAESVAFITAAYLLFVKALSSGAVGIIVPLANSYPLVTIALSAVFLDQVFSAGKLVALVGIVLGATLLAYEKNHKKIPLKELHKDTIIALGASLLWGIAFFILNPVVTEVSWQVLTIMVEVIAFPIAVLLLFISAKSNTPKVMKETVTNKTVLVIGAIGTTGGAALYLGSDYAGSIIIPTVLSAAGPLVASWLGAVFDKEKIGAVKRAGAVFVVAGIVILNLA